VLALGGSETNEREIPVARNGAPPCPVMPSSCCQPPLPHFHATGARSLPTGPSICSKRKPIVSNRPTSPRKGMLVHLPGELRLSLRTSLPTRVEGPSDGNSSARLRRGTLAHPVVLREPRGPLQGALRPLAMPPSEILHHCWRMTRYEAPRHFFGFANRPRPLAKL
jgi:hypothetical protein